MRKKVIIYMIINIRDKPVFIPFLSIKQDNFVNFNLACGKNLFFLSF
jgi:hypothetical protein